MPKTTSGNVLILDDDAGFRELVKQILESRGYGVVEASTPEAGMQVFSREEPCLIIVDYRLPKMDGITWIEKLRDSGRNTPVVFCSAIPCDSLTFNKLRNILRVSLIVRKPIIPGSFIEQVESLLPGYEKTYMQVSLEDGNAYQYYATDTTTQEMVQELAVIKKKMDLQRAIEIARLDYLKDLEASWRTLTELVDIHNNDKSRLDVLVEATHIAHRIRGTAGSLGLMGVSEIAGRLEDLMQNLDGREDTDQEIYWSEVIRLIVRGHEEISTTAQQSTEIQEPEFKSTVLIVSNAPDVADACQNSEVKTLARIELADSPQGVAESLAKQKVDAMLLEVTSNKEMSFQRAADIRLMPGNRALPLGVFIPEDFELTEVERIYVGASVVIPHPVQADGLHEGIDALLMMTHAVRPRVLAIDDDEVLCRFVSSVLEGERIEAKTCTNPSLALEKISEFRPDVVLLDVMMPGLTGFEVCRMIREQPELKELPVVFLTSKTSPESRSAAFSVGANDFVTKPVLAPELINRVMNQLNESSLKRQSRTRDPETGVMNGDVIMAQAKLLLEDHLEIGAPMSLALLQMDEYDHLSLVQGQFSARQASKRFGELIQQRYRSEDLRGRWSDGGYVLILANCDRDMAASTIQLLQEDFRRFEFPGSAFSFSTTFSAGVADCERDGSKLEDIIKSAHRRMKAAMQTSANSVGFSD